MNKRVVAVVLAGAMAASQLAGPVEVIAAQIPGEVKTTASETPEKVLEEGAGVDTPVEIAKDNSVQTQAEVKGWLKTDNKVYTVDGSGTATTTEITDLATVTHLLVGPSVTGIPNELFKDKTNLTKVEIMGPTNTVSPETNVSLTSIGTSAFEGTGLTTVALPGALTSIGASAFKNTKALANVTFAGGVKLETIGANAFEGADKLLEVTDLPATLTSIGNAAFKGTTALANVDLSTATGLLTIGTNSFEASGVVSIGVPAAVTTIGNDAFNGALGLTTLDVSKAVALTSIGNNAFKGADKLAGLVDLTPTKVATIGNNAFEGSKVTEMKFPATLTSIGDSAFAGVVSLIKADLDTATALTTIGASAFEGTGLTTVKIPATVTSVGISAFKNSKSLGTVDLTTATLYTTIGNATFEGAGLTTVVIPATVTGIGQSAFAGNEKMTTVDFSAGTGLLTVGESAFENSALTGELDLTGMTKAVDISTKAFKGNELVTGVKLPAEMTSLKAEVLAGTAIKTIELNEKCTAVETGALPGTLETITVKAGNAALAAEDGVLYDNTKANLKLVPMAKAGEFTVPATVTTIEANAAKGNTKLTGVKLADASVLKDIEANAFEDAAALKVLDLRKATKLENIKAAAFKGSVLDLMYLGAGTRDFTGGIAADAFTSKATTKIVKFLKDDDTEVDTADLSALETTWTKLTTAAGGSWTFYRTPTKPATPAATANYTDMKLESLTAGTKYKITVDASEEEHTADTDGKIAIKKEWGGKTIKIASVASGNNLESDAQELEIKGIYTVTVDGSIEKTTVAGEKVTFTASVIVDKTFVKWEAVGITLTDVTAKDITFDMPANDVTLTKVYKTTNTVAPTAATDYAAMKLTGLSPSAAYTIESKEVAADSEGKVAIEKAWGGKEITIVKNETETETQSPEQKLQIDPIYSITVGETEVAISVKDEAVTIKAPNMEGHLFKKWTDGYSELTVTVGSETTETITFTMLDKDITLKAEYTLIMITKPEELEYNGDKEVSVEFDVPFADFEGIMVDGVMLEKDKDYTVSDGSVATLSSGKTIVKFTKAYLDSLQKGVNAFKAVLKGGKEVDFSIKVSEKPEKPEKPGMEFPDVDTKEWYHGAISHVSSKELMTGYADGKFGPADSLGRGQFASILHRMAGSPVVSYQGRFTDVPDGTFYTMPVLWAKENNIITGYEGGDFGPSDSMTREQLATMLYRYAMKEGGDVTTKASIETYPDSAKVSDFAKEAMGWAVGTGVISGDQGSLNPQGISSRAVAATMIQRFETKVKPEQPQQP